MIVIGIITLQSCAMLDHENGSASANSSSTGQAISIASGDNAASSPEIPVISGTNNAEQQAVIDAINRDGQIFQYAGFNEFIPQL